jgi:nucleoside-diphosphate-sugar epimerase
MRIDDGRVVPNFLAQALAHEPLTVYGDGTQTRSFTYVDDIVEGVIRTANLEDASGLIVNLGHTEETTICDVAKLVAELTGTRCLIETHPRPTDEPSRRCPDLSRAHALLAWTPSVPLRDGLSRTLRWWREQRARERT